MFLLPCHKSYTFIPPHLTIKMSKTSQNNLSQSNINFKIFPLNQDRNKLNKIKPTIGIYIDSDMLYVM